MSLNISISLQTIFDENVLDVLAALFFLITLTDNDSTFSTISIL
jgi:hypothetical protein